MKHSSSSSNIFLIVAVVLVLVFVILFSASNTFYPHDSSIFTKLYAYEGFNAKPNPIHYSTYPNNLAVDQEVKHDIVPSKSSVQPLWGFGGLFGPPNAPDNSLDMYSTAPGSLSEKCQNLSAGYSNSKGHLCLNADQIKMLTTRGGNQTVAGSQVGTGSL